MRLTFDMYIAAPSDRVWSALTDGALTEQYFYNSRVKSTFQPGAPIAWTAGDMKMIDGEILSVERGKQLVVSQRALWDEGVKKDPASQVSFELSALGAATKVRVTHEGLSAGSETCKQSTDGWPVILSGMKTLLETGKPLSLPSA